MQIGEYITDRWIVEVIRDICAERGLDFKTFSSGWVLEMGSGEKRHHVIGYQFDINSAVASSIAKDKVAAHLILKDNGVPSVPHALLRPKVSDAQRQAIAGWNDLVVKPLDGSGGYYVRRFDSSETAIEWIESTEIPAWAASPFVDIKREIRMIMLGHEPLIVYEKKPVVKDNLKMFNLGLGGEPNNLVPDDELLMIAVKAQAALGLRICAVDVAELASGERQVLEINSGFMMEHYMRFSPENKQQTIEMYRRIVDAVMA